MSEPENRNPEGRFKPGQSGNPGGRPKEEREVIQIAREASPDAIRRLIALMQHESPRAAIAAATAVLDRAFGKPAQTLAGDPERPLHATSTVDVSSLPEAVLKALASVKLPTE